MALIHSIGKLVADNVCRVSGIGFQMVGRVEHDQLVKCIRMWTCKSSVPQSMVRQCELQKQRLRLVAIMEFLGRYFM